MLMILKLELIIFLIKKKKKNKKKIFILKDDMITRFLNIDFKKIDIIYNKTSSTWKRYAKVCE